MLGRLSPLFTFKGRTRRLAYLGGMFAAWLVCFLVFILGLVLEACVSYVSYAGGKPRLVTGLVFELPSLVAVFVGAAAILALTIRRLHDMDMSGWHTLWIFIVFV